MTEIAIRALPCPRSSQRDRMPGRGCAISSAPISATPTHVAPTRAVRQFSAFCASMALGSLPCGAIHVAAFVEVQLRLHSRPTVKLRLAALRMLFDWMVVGRSSRQSCPCSARAEAYAKEGKTPALNVDEARVLIDAIDTTSLPACATGL